AIPTILSFVLLMAACLFIKPEPVATQNREQVCLAPKAVIPWIALFMLCLLTVAHVLHYGIVLAVVLLSVLFLNWKLLPKADYGLLLTFVFFFIFIGNMKNIPAVSEFLSNLVAGRELTIGILLSQIISNVPAAMLLSGFTTQFEPLLLGVNLGGLGTLIASMASLISYKLYAATEGADMGRYMGVFTGLNVLFLAVLWVLTVFFV
ncbi:MAG: citrate transporter, partial [Oscillospiraceae bacterium]|nr:citrate transporter [Oscillospiraceae bacterium]